VQGKGKTELQDKRQDRKLDQKRTGLKATLRNMATEFPYSTVNVFSANKFSNVAP
jgi:hypothetical protein